ncbi:MAG: virulence RhuM family protein [Aquamicrobium sp.]|uniref:RhuM family protein n=1 Tax=Aquamicrobium sp. TaxID=1872579 RepID=UPI00349E9B04|nr:virulence RhuM family protein [Aquamicrobium sp.]
MANENDKKRSFGARVKTTVNAAVEFVKGVVQFDAFARFKSDGKEIDFPIDFDADTVLATQAQMAELFAVTKPTINEHLQTLFRSGEVDENAVVRKSRITASDGKSYVTKLYDLDAVIAVGYRVNSKRATEFRKWSASVLKGYIQDGYALNGKRLNSDPAALLKLAQEVRAIRTSEKNLYTQVRETFAQCAIDYDKDDPAARTFFSTSQDTFHYAASGQTAVQIIMSRADASKPNMGAIALGNRMPTAGDVTVAKNFCSSDELRKMELIGEAWLLYAEGMAMQGKQVSMQRLLDKLKELVAQYEFPVFPGYGDGPKRDAANKFAKAQLELFKKNSRLPRPSA